MFMGKGNRKCEPSFYAVSRIFVEVLFDNIKSTANGEDRFYSLTNWSQPSVTWLRNVAGKCPSAFKIIFMGIGSY